MQGFEFCQIVNGIRDIQINQKWFEKSLNAQNEILKAILLNAEKQTELLTKICDYLESNSHNC